MRTLIAAAAVLFAVGTTSPVIAASPASAGSNLVQVLPGAGSAGLTVRKKKKKETATFQEIGTAKIGNDLKIKIKVSKPDRKCELELTWKDGSTADVDDEDSDADKICKFTIAVPNSKKIVGDATVKVTVRDGTDKKVASEETTFPVDNK